MRTLILIGIIYLVALFGCTKTVPNGTGATILGNGTCWCTDGIAHRNNIIHYPDAKLWTESTLGAPGVFFRANDPVNNDIAVFSGNYHSSDKGHVTTVKAVVRVPDGFSITFWGTNQTAYSDRWTSECSCNNWSELTFKVYDSDISDGLIKFYRKNQQSLHCGTLFPIQSGGANTVLTTTAANSVTQTSAISGGNITSDGGFPITARGVCYSINPNPTVSGNHTTNGTGLGIFSSSLSSLAANTLYYVRAYATNSLGTVYGNQLSFTTGSGASYTIGQSHGGGIIIYVDGSGQHGWIAATVDQGDASWSNGSLLTTNATSISDGASNTAAIINAQGNNGSYAAKLCRDYRGGNYADWYLPSKDQLSTLMSYNTILNLATNGAYWNSTEANSSTAWDQYVVGNLQISEGKIYLNHVRAIRSF